MPRPRVDPVNELEELRRLLLSRDREQLRELRTQVTDKERRSRDVAAILPEALKLSRERGEELSRALRPAVENSVRDSIAQRPGTFVEALHPIIGPIVRRSIAESMRRLLQSLNQTLEHTFSWRGLRWRFEALRTGRSFAEVVMLRSLVYRVEQVFLIHRATSLALLHVAADPALGRDSDMVAGMLSAIQDFARDSFALGEESTLEEFRVGQLEVWVAPGRHAFLAAVVRGTPPRELRATLEEAIESIHVLQGSALAHFNGDAAQFEALRPELEACLRAQYSREKTGRRPSRAWFLLVILAALCAGAIVSLWRAERRWQHFVGELAAQPGIVITEAQRHWFRPSEVSGLRDHAAVDPEQVAQRTGMNPARIRFAWKDYLALDPASVQRRVDQRFQPPAGARLAVEGNHLVVSGAAPYEWLTRVRSEGTLVAGVAAIEERDLRIAYDPALAARRFEEQLGLPEGVTAAVANGKLILTGEASHRWLAKIRDRATTLPGITALDERKVVDVDQRAFNESRSVIANAFVYFLLGKDNIATEGFAALSRLPEELRRCQSAASRLGLEILLEIHGHADSVGAEEKNRDLSLRRAEKVRDFLQACGFRSEMLLPLPQEAPPTTPEGKPLPDEAERRVQFKVVPRPLALP